MKNLNFSTKSSSQSGSHRVVTLASTVGSPSAHRRGGMVTHLTFMLLFLFGSLNAWGDSFALVTNVNQLSAGDQIIIVNTGGAKAMSTAQNPNNRGSVAVSVSNNKISSVTNLQVLTLGTATKNSSTYWTLQPSSGNYLYAASSSNNYLKTKSTLADECKWSITLNASYEATITSQGSYTRNTIKNNGDLFSCYASGQTAVKIYKKETASCTKKVTLTKGSQTNGTFSLNKSNGSYDNCDENFVVTVSGISANTGYYCSGVTATGGNSEITGPDGSGNYTVTYTKGNNITSTITANFSPKTARTVTFMNNGAQYGDVRNLYDGDAVGTLPTAPSSCKVGKVFVGWSETNIGVTPTDVAPSFISASTVVSGSNKVYHAVFATLTPGEEEVLSQTLSYDSWTYSGTTADKTSYRLFGNNSYVQSASFDLSTLSKVIVYGGTFGGDSYNSLTIGDGTNTWKSVTVSGSSQTGTNTYTDGTALSGTGSLRVTSNSGNGSSNGVRISQIKIYTIPNVYSGYITECCTELGQINGSVTLSQLAEGVNAGKLQATWLAQSNTDGWAANGIQIKIYEEGNATPVVTSEALANSTTSFTANDFTPKTCTNYYATLTALHGGNASYCAGNLVSDPSENVTTAGYTYVNNSTNVNLVAALPASTCANGGADVNIQFTAAAGYRLPSTDEEIDANVSVTNAGEKDEDWSCGFANDILTITVNPTKATGNIGIKVDGIVTIVPEISVSKTEIDFNEVKKGVATSTTFTVEGANLSNNITLSSDEDAFTLSTYSLTQEGGSVALTTITLTANTSTAGEYMGTITISDGNDGATDKSIDVYLTVLETYTVNWYINNTETPVHTQTDVANTAYDEVPSDFSAFTDCSEFTFVGWSETAFGSTTSSPSLAEVGTKITANKNYYAVFAEGTPGGTNELLNETFDNDLSSDGTQALESSDEVLGDFNGETSKAYKGANGTIKFGTGSYAGYITSKQLDLSRAFTVSLKAKYYNTGGDNASVQITVGERVKTISKEDLANELKPFSFNFEAATSTSTIKIGTDAKRAYIDDVLVTQTAAPVWTKWYTTCPHVTRVTLNAPEVSNGSISFAQDSKAVTNVRTDDGNAVVDVVASPATGYELTDLTLTSEDVTGADKNQTLTQITIPQNEEGTLTVAATFSQKNYTVTLNHTEGVEPEMTGATDEAHYGGTIHLITTVPSNAKFVNWTSSDVTIANPTSATEASFTMPAKAVTVTANFIVVHNVAWAIENTPSTSTLAGVYVKGIVKANPSVSTQYNNADYFICDLDANGEPANEFYVYRGKNVDNTNFTNVNQLAEGDEVVIIGTLKTYQGTKEFDAGNYIIANGRTAAAVSSVVVSGTADKTEYFASETFQFAGLNARAIYNTGYQKDVTAAATWKANGEDSYTVSTSENVNVTAAYGGETSANYPISVTVTTKTLQSIEVSPAALTGYKGVTLPKPATVTAHFDDQGVASESNVTALAIYDEANVYNATSTSEQTIQVKYSFGLNTRTANYTVTLSSIANTLNTAYSVNKAREIIDLDQEAGNDLDLANADNKVYVVGRVTSVENNQIIIKDDADETKVLYLWKYDYETGITSVEVGDLIKAYGNLKLYSPKYEMDEGCKIVWKQPKVELSFANKTMEVGENRTISGTVTPAEAPVTFSIKAGSDECIALNGDEITATAVGTATIVVTAEDYNEYLGNSKEFTVTVSPAKIHTDVVILAEYNGHYYALNNTAGTTEVQFENGMVIVPDQDTKMAILWDRAEREGVATFYNAKASKFLNGGTSTALGMETEEGTYTSWTWVETETKAYYTSNLGASARTFMYNMNGQTIKNYAVSNIGNGSYAQANVYTGAVAVKISSNTDVSDLPENASVLVEEGVTLTVDAESTLDNLIVENGGKVTLSSNKLTVVGTFSIETTMAGGNSGQLEGATASNFEASEAYIDITLGAGGTNQQWHAFTVPFPVDVMSGIYDLDDNKLNNEVNYAIMEYFGDERAKGSYGWKKIRTTLVPGTFYIMATDGKRTTYRFKKKAGAALVAENSKEIFKFAASGDGVSTDAGWNGVGNPTLTYGKVGVEVQVLDPGSYTFVKKDANSTNFVVGTPFFYQAAAAGSISMLEANAGASYAPRRVAANGFEKIKVAFGNEEFTDYLDVSASEEALNEYQIGKDLAKMTMTNTPKVAQIFGKAYNTKLCMVHAPMVNDQAEVALELYAPQAGTYTISVPTEREDASLYLTKDGNIIWDLTVSPYEAEFDKGATEGYGLMLVRKAPQVTTGVETIDNSQSTIHNCQKVILNDHVYILRDGQLYDVTGKAVK